MICKDTRGPLLRAAVTPRRSACVLHIPAWLVEEVEEEGGAGANPWWKQSRAGSLFVTPDTSVCSWS